MSKYSLDTFADIFGGTISLRINDYKEAGLSKEEIEWELQSSDFFSQAIPYLENVLDGNTKVLKEINSELVNWINSPVLDALYKETNSQFAYSPFITVSTTKNLKAMIWFHKFAYTGNDYEYPTAFDKVCKSGFLEGAKWLYENFPDKIRPYWCNGYESLFENNYTEFIDWFIKTIPKPIAGEDNEAFRYACKNGNMELAKFLYYNREIDMKKNGLALRYVCIYNGNLELVKWLCSLPGLNIREFRDSPFWHACTHGYLDVVKYLLQIVPEIDLTVLNYCAYAGAANNGHQHVIDWLLKNYPHIVPPKEKLVKRT